MARVPAPVASGGERPRGRCSVSSAGSRVNGSPPHLVAPAASSASVRRRMQAVRRSDTGPELALRSILHAMGFRYRVNVAPNGGRRRADMVFSKARVAVFVDGCFWHGCPEHGHIPGTNADFWRQKIGWNQAKDRLFSEALLDQGWAVVRVWEHEPATAAANRVSAVLRLRLGCLAVPTGLSPAKKRGSQPNG